MRSQNWLRCDWMYGTATTLIKDYYLYQMQQLTLRSFTNSVPGLQLISTQRSQSTAFCFGVVPPSLPRVVGSHNSNSLAAGDANKFLRLEPEFGGEEDNIRV